MQDLIIFGCLTLTVVALFRIVKVHNKERKDYESSIKDLNEQVKARNMSDTSDKPKIPLYRQENF